MAWYPLNGNLKDYSGNYPDWENNNLVEYESGKIGKTYHFSSTEYGKLSINGIVPTKDSEFSIAYWVKELKDNSSTGFRVVYQGGGYIIGQYRDHFDSYFTGGGGDVNSPSVDLTKWNHCVVTCTKNGLMTIYVNGEKGSSTQISKYPTAGSTYLGRRTAGGSNEDTDMYINDLRLYDHCLSDAEIKQLSQGLIVHYNMESKYGNENLLIGAQMNKDYSNKNWTQYGLNNVSKNEYINGAKHIMTPSSGNIANNGEGFSWTDINTSPLEVGKTYTFSIDIMGTISSESYGGYLAYMYNSTESAAVYEKIIHKTYFKDTLSPTCYQRYAMTFTVTNAIKYKFACQLLLGYGADIYYKNVKLEVGENKNPVWIPNPADETYVDFGYDKNKVYDISGFENDGMATNLTYSTNNKIGLASTVFDGKTSKIITETGSFKWFQFDECTIAAWMKPYNTPDTYTGGIGVTYDGNTLKDDNGRTFSINNHSGIFCVDGIKDEAWVTYSSGYTLPLNEWTFCVATLDKEGYIHFYINGEEIKKVLCNFGTTTYTNAKTLFQVGVDLARWR